MDTHDTRRSPRKTKSRTWLWLAAVVVGACSVSAVIYHQTRGYAIGQAEEEIQNLLSQHKAIHLYTQRDAHPALYKAKNDGQIEQDFYSPEFLSSSYMVRNTHAYLNEVRKEGGDSELYYKMAATNPRNAVNIADALEKKLIEMFNADRAAQEYRDVIEIDGKKHLYYARPFLETDPACLKCHGDRQAAPRQLQARYTGMGGFGDHAGNIRAIESIRAPIEGELAVAQSAFIAILAVGFGVATLLSVNRRLARNVRVRTRTLEEQIAERTRAEQAMRESEERLQRILDTIQVGVLIIDAETRTVVDANPTALRMIGAYKEQVVGHVCHKYLCPSETGQCPITDCGKKADSAERVLLTIDGQSVPILKGVNRLTLDGRPHLLECFVDISDRKQAEERLRENMAEVERFNALAIGREERMIELKRQINELAEKAGEQAPYDLSFIDADRGSSRETGIVPR